MELNSVAVRWLRQETLPGSTFERKKKKRKRGHFFRTDLCKICILSGFAKRLINYCIFTKNLIHCLNNLHCAAAETFYTCLPSCNLLSRPSTGVLISPYPEQEGTKLMFLSEWREFPSAPCLARKQIADTGVLISP